MICKSITLGRSFALSFLLTISLLGDGYGQKKLIPIQINNWLTINNGKISDDGQFIMYTKSDGRFTQLIVAKNGIQFFQLQGDIHSPVIDSQNAVLYFQKADTLFAYSLVSKKLILEFLVKKWEIIEQNPNISLVYIDPDNVLHLKKKNKELIFSEVSSYVISKAGNSLILQNDLKENSKRLRWVNLDDGKVQEIVTAPNISSINFNHSGTGAVYVYTNTDQEQKLVYYTSEKGNTHLLVNKSGHNLKYQGISSFSNDDKTLLTTWKETRNFDTTLVYKTGQLRIWTTNMTSQMPEGIGSNRDHKITFNLTSGKISYQSDSTEQILNPGKFGKYLIIAKVPEKNYGLNLRADSNTTFEMYSFIDQKTTNLFKGPDQGAVIEISPDNAHVLYFNPLSKHFFSYSIKTGIIRNVTVSIDPVPVYVTDWDYPIHPRSYGFAGFTEGGKALIYDKFDIWEIDLEGKSKPLCITTGIGRTNGIRFRLLQIDATDKLLKSGKSIYLTGFNLKTKAFGFYRIQPGSKQKPEELSSGNFILDEILKAGASNSYLLKRSSVNSAPNYYLTHDFRKFQQISDVQPQKEYNWISSELISYPSWNGTSEAILYKPENFDPNKKYPMIFHYYQKNSENLNQFLKPEIHGSSLNIPFYVSNGYLVCVPDVYYRVGQPGLSSSQSIIAAAKYIAKLAYVDSLKMGLQGHSFGGYETNFLITQTNIFAAAVSVAGASDETSKVFTGVFGIDVAEVGQSRIGKPFYSNPDMYYNNSPLTFAKNVKTPLLVVHGSDDIQVPFSQGEEWFNALRRLSKPVWLLEYRNQGHILGDKAALDFEMRMAHFFDHYLKGATAEGWLKKIITIKYEHKN